MKLSDCGKKVNMIIEGYGGHPITITPKIIMVIKAPRGMMSLTDYGNISTQCDAIRAFMKEHIHD